MKLLAVLMFTLIGFLGTNSYSQTESDSTQVNEKYYLVIKNDGSEYYGYILKDDGREILLQTSNIGKIYINKSEIKEIREVKEADAEKKINSGEYTDLREEGPFTTRYYFTTNALPIKKKENYALIHLYGPEVHFAVSDNLSLGVMATWIASPIALAAKYSFNNPNPESDLNFAVGAIVGSGGYLAPQAYGGLYFGTVTKGNRSSNISFSAGFAHINVGSNFGISYDLRYKYQSNDVNGDFYVPSEFYPTNNQPYVEDTKRNNASVVLGFSGIKAVGKKTSFIFDSMIFFTQRRTVQYDKTTVINFTDGDWQNPGPPQDFTVQEGRYVNNGIRPTIVLMPGMRFSTKYGTAIQVVLSGFIFQQSSGDFIGVPVPQVSWLKAF